MSRTSAVAGMPQVALVLETSTEYGRGLLRGILRYSRLHGPWSVYVAPEQALPKSWSGTGIIARMCSPEIAGLVRATGLPFVAPSLDEFRSPRRKDGFGEIRSNSAAIAQMAAAHLIDRNLPHFAYCGFHGCGWSARHEEAFSQSLRARGFQCQAYRLKLAAWMQRPNWIQCWEYRRPGLVEWLKALRKPVGLLACNDICGREVLEACAAAGLRVPGDVTVVGVDNDELVCELSDPPLSSVALDLEKAGYEAARLLDNLMSGRLAEEHVVQIEPVHLVTRQSSEIIAPDDPCAATALRFIKDHAEQAIGVAHVVEQVNVSRRTLERRFFRALGRSVSSVITQYRLERAKRLLLESDLPSHRVAVESGFGTTKTFNRVFRRAVRITPIRFRRNATA